jgi:hypothetical protein
MNESLSELELRSRAAFDESVQSIDAATRQRLVQARAKALAQLDRPRFPRATIWVPAAAAASALVAALVWRTEDPDMRSVEIAQLTNDELPLLPAEDFELLQEEEGFYAWAAEQMSDGVG